MNSLIENLDAMGILSAARLQPFYPRVRDRDDIAVLRDPVSDVLVLSRSDHMSMAYYEAKPETPGHAVHGNLVVAPSLEDDMRRAQEFGPLLRNKRWLDFGCGLGGVLDALKGQTTWAAGLEPARERAAIASGKGHAIVGSLDEVKPQSLDVVTLFHVLEHLTEPLETLRQIRARLAKGGRVLVEVPHARDVLFTLYDCEPFKKFTFWSEHLVLHTRQSLKLLLEHAGFESIEISGRQRYPLSNHLYWLSQGKPGGHEAWAFLNSPNLLAEYEATLARIDRTDTLIAMAVAPRND